MNLKGILVAAGLAVAALGGTAPAQAHPWHDGGYYGGGYGYYDRGDRWDRGYDDRRYRRDWRDDRRWNRNHWKRNRGHHYGWNDGRRCWREWHRGYRVRVCDYY